ncbi:MAG: peptidylprolyl isomerase [Gammaproteobacteria bacterium]|nr:peptidylprolyl isomerase [Gammaproteobacteria bacterium]
MLIDNHKVITINYTLKDDDGKLIDESNDGSFCYLHGADNIIPGMEQALHGKSKDDQLQLSLKPEQAYGEYVEALTQVVDRSMFDVNDTIEAGMQFQAQSENGQMIMITVTKVDGDNVTIDGNHPLAGETLHYDITVIDVRDATEEEISHGHVHMPGHHHDH